MQIDKILYQLLLQHECIIVPDFGGFIVRESPCNFNVNKDVLKPYSKSIFFNPHLNENDGLLINAIVNSKNISYTEAALLLEKWIAGQNNDMSENGKSIINGIGVFHKGNDNGKWFTADTNLNLALSTYGLRPVKTSVVHSEVIANEEHIIEFKPLADNKPLESFEPPKTSWKAWAAAAAIALVAHIGYLSFEKNDHAVQHASIVPSISNADSEPAEIATEETAPDVAITEEVLSNEPAPIEISPSEEPTKETIAEPVPVEETILIPAEPAPVMNETAVTISNNVIVIGKYRLEQNAYYHQKDLLKAGISAEIRQNENGLFEVIKVSAASH